MRRRLFTIPSVAMIALALTIDAELESVSRLSSGLDTGSVAVVRASGTERLERSLRNRWPGDDEYVERSTGSFRARHDGAECRLALRRSGGVLPRDGA